MQREGSERFDVCFAAQPQFYYTPLGYLFCFFGMGCGRKYRLFSGYFLPRVFQSLAQEGCAGKRPIGFAVLVASLASRFGRNAPFSGLDGALTWIGGLFSGGSVGRPKPDTHGSLVKIRWPLFVSRKAARLI